MTRTFRFRCIPTLPRLAWCASIRQGAEAAEVWHGPWVETTAAGFVEGAWDDDFGAGRFDQAQALFGSGGLAEDAGWLFAAPCHMLAHLFVLADAGRLLISNSLAFLLAQADDGLDMAHPGYYFDFLRHRRRGLRQPAVGFSIPTARGRRITLHAAANLRVLPDLSWRVARKNSGPAPAGFDDYRRLLETSLRRVCANAADPRRQHRYRPLIALSQGLDSPAVAALAGDACHEALTFTMRQAGGDAAAPIAAYLGLALSAYDRDAYRQLPGAPEAEFCATMAFGSLTPLAAAESQLEGALLLTGNYGDDLWTTGANKVLPDFLAPTDSLVEFVAVHEFRLRVGFAFFPVPWIGAGHGPAIHGISVSEPMRPWRLGGRYDRPIPRRLAETTGLPRGSFGQRKVGGLHRFMSASEAMSPAGYEAFRSFCAANNLRPHRRPWDGMAALGGRLHMWAVAALRRLPQWLYLGCLPLAGPWGLGPLRDRAHPLWRSPYLYTFHWGIEAIRSRYTVDLFSPAPP